MLHVVEETGCATAAGYYRVVEISHLMKHLALNLAEALLTIAVEKFPYRGVITLLDVEVKINEGDSRGGRESLAECGLSTSHISDDKDRFHDYLFNDLLIFSDFFSNSSRRGIIDIRRRLELNTVCLRTFGNDA